MLRSLGTLHVLGHPVAWDGVYPGSRHFVRLPTYPWQRERYWHEAEESRTSRLTAPAHPLLGVIQGGPAKAWESRLDLRLTPLPAEDNTSYEWVDPAPGPAGAHNCANCHADTYR